jgi:hypothetical protein
MRQPAGPPSQPAHGPAWEGLATLKAHGKAGTRHAGGKPYLSRGGHSINEVFGPLEKFAQKVNGAAAAFRADLTWPRYGIGASSQV